MYSILTPRCCVFSVKQFPFIKKRACCESKQAGVTVFLNAESSFTGDPHFSKVFVEESKRYGLFRWTFHLAVLWHFKVRPAFFFFFPPSFSLPPFLPFFFFFMCAPRMNGPTSYNLRRATPPRRWTAAPVKFHSEHPAWDSTHPRDHFLRIAVFSPRIAPRTRSARYLAPDAFDNRAGQRYFLRPSREIKRRQDFDSSSETWMCECVIWIEFFLPRIIVEIF